MGDGTSIAWTAGRPSAVVPLPALACLSGINCLPLICGSNMVGCRGNAWQMISLLSSHYYKSRQSWSHTTGGEAGGGTGIENGYKNIPYPY